MARSWAELLGDEAAAADEAERSGLFSRLRESLGKSRRALTEELALGSFDPADEASWERLEEALIAADVGVPATAELVQRLEARGDGADLADALQEEIARMLGEPGRLELAARPSVVLVVGVNGSSRSGRRAPVPISSALSAAATRPRLRSMRSEPRSHEDGTSSWSTPPAGSTRRRT